MSTTIVIYPNERRVVVKGALIFYVTPLETYLTVKEMEVLTFLAKYQKKACHRHDIEEAVWPGRLNLSNVVDVYIKYLRKKIDRRDEWGFIVIETVQGIGYRLNAEVSTCFGEES
jgi:DNA-binding response OmpR family regulator